MEVEHSFGAWLQRRRKTLGLTQGDLARQVGCAEVTVQKIEADERRPSTQVAARLATALRLPDDLHASFTAAARGALAVDRLPPPAALDALPPAVPARSQSTAPAHNLPEELTSFIGRERELALVSQRLAEARLVTLTGTGGTGKTRLALRAARAALPAFPDGVWLVELAPLADPELIPQTIATALGLREEPGQPLLRTLTDFLQSRRLLLLLDNCEHLIAACAASADTLLRTTTQLVILASSREPLGVPGEVIVQVPTLSLPPTQPPSSPEELAACEAAQLFVARAQAIEPAFTVTAANALALARICRRLDGIALALELAAARLRLLPIEQLADRLDESLRLLSGGARTALPRHQTLTALIDWSYALLTAAEQALLRRLAVFAGGWTLHAAETVCADDPVEDVVALLANLVDKSLVQVEPHGALARYRMLETIRQYALERLAASGEAEERRRRHGTYYLAVSQQAEGQLTTNEDHIWLRALEREHDNLRAALEWSLGGGDGALGAKLAVALGPYWELRGNLSEATTWLASALNQPVANTPHLRAQALSTAAWIAFRQGYLDEPMAMIEESLALYRTCGSTAELASALHKVGVIAHHLGQLQRAETALEEALALSEGAADVRTEAYILGELGWLVRGQEQYGRAQAFLEQGLALLQRLGDRQGIQDQQILCWTLWQLGNVARGAGDDQRAERSYAEALVLARRVGDRSLIAAILHNQAFLSIHQHDARRAEALLLESTLLSREVGNVDQLAWNLAAFGGVAVLQGRPASAVRMLSAADTWFCNIKRTLEPTERAEHESYLAAARAQLSAEAFAAAWAAGRSMSLEQAVAEALKATSPIQVQSLPVAQKP